MSAATADDRILKTHAAEETVEHLVPAVEDLLQRIIPEGVVATADEIAGYRMTSELTFPDGVGRGRVVARLFRYREGVRLDVELQHNRVFADRIGAPTERRCFMNDYVASIRLDLGSEQLPADFVRTTLRGMRSAQDAVAEFNRNNPQPWRQVRVAAVA
jgi:hypothetical protein